MNRALVAASALGGLVLLAAPPPEKPDLTSRNGLRIGTTTIPWGNAVAVEIKASDALQPGDAACAFSASYEMSNKGGAPASPPFTNRLRVDGTNVVAVNAGLTIGPFATTSLSASPYLPAGEHALQLSLDDDGVVAESDKTNNRFVAKYRLAGPCGRPAAPPGKK